MLMKKLTMLTNKPKIDWMKCLRDETSEPCPKCKQTGEVYMRKWEWSDKKRYAKGTYCCHICHSKWTMEFNDY